MGGGGGGSDMVDRQGNRNLVSSQILTSIEREDRGRERLAECPRGVCADRGHKIRTKVHIYTGGPWLISFQ